MEAGQITGAHELGSQFSRDLDRLTTDAGFDANNPAGSVVPPSLRGFLVEEYREGEYLDAMPQPVCTRDVATCPCFRCSIYRVRKSQADVATPTKIVGHCDLSTGDGTTRGGIRYISIREAIDILRKETDGVCASELPVEIHLQSTAEDDINLALLRAKIQKLRRNDSLWRDGRQNDGWTSPAARWAKVDIRAPGQIAIALAARRDLLRQFIAGEIDCNLVPPAPSPRPTETMPVGPAESNRDVSDSYWNELGLFRYCDGGGEEPC